jgi:hypothetical protein
LIGATILRHPGEGRDLTLSSERTGETPAFAGVTMLCMAYFR